MRFLPKVLDLHGYDISKATAVVMNALYELKNSEYDHDYIDIITGNGTGALKLQVESILEKEQCNFYFLNESRSIIRVYKD